MSNFIPKIVVACKMLWLKDDMARFLYFPVGIGSYLNKF